MTHGLHDAKVDPEEKVQKRKVVDLGPIVLDAERCVLCSRCIRFERFVTGTDSFEFRNRGDHTQIATFEDRPITHNYAWNLADVCPVGALLSHDFRFKMRVWFLEAEDSVCPGCSTGCNIFIDHRDGEVHRLRPRRNVDVNKSWMCDIGRVEYKEIALDTRVTAARVRGASGWKETTVATALDAVVGEDPGRAARLRLPGHAAGHQRRRLHVPPPLRARGRHARLPRRQPAGQGPGARGQRPPARRPQPQHHRLPRPGDRPARAWTRSSTPARRAR